MYDVPSGSLSNAWPSGFLVPIEYLVQNLLHIGRLCYNTIDGFYHEAV